MLSCQGTLNLCLLICHREDGAGGRVGGGGGGCGDLGVGAVSFSTTDPSLDLW